MAALLCGESAHAQVVLSGQVELARLIDLSAQRLGVRITYDDSLVKAKITIRQDKPVGDPDLWLLTNRVLAEQGLTTIRAGDDQTLAVVKLAVAAQTARVERIELPIRPPGADEAKTVTPGFRRVLVPLRRASSKDVIAAVQLVLSKPAGVVIEAEQAGLVSIADLSPYLDAALKLVEQLDGEQGGVVVGQVPVRNVDAARLAALVKQLIEKRKSVGGRDLRGDLIAVPGAATLTLLAPPALVEQWEGIIADADQREPVERRTYTTGPFGLREVANLIEQAVRGGNAGPSAGPAGTGSGAPSGDDRWRIVQDDLTGTLIITCSIAQHDQIAELLVRLASVPAEARRPVKTFKIRNRPVKELQQVVEELLRAGALEVVGADTTSPANVPGPLGQTQGVAPQTTPRPFSPGGQSGSSTGAASGASANPTESLMPAGLGGGPARPTIGGSTKANSAPLTLTSDEPTNTLIAVGEPRLLAQLEKLLPTLDVRQPQVMLEAFLVSLSDSQSFDLGVELEKLHITGDTLIRLSSLFGLSTAAGSGAARTRAVGDSTGFTGVVLDPGDFSVVVKALESVNHGRSLSSPRVLVSNNQQATFNSVLQQPFASTNASTTVSTTSFGGTQDAGTTISVKPQIAQGDHLSLTYSVSLSSFTGAASNPNLPPPRQQNTVQSIATVPDAYTVVVGGLEATSDGENTTQTPLVSHIPLVGELFKDRSRTRSHTRFFVFIRATVLRQGGFEDLKYISDRDTAAADVDGGWPVVEPRVIGGGR
ncbi:MAG TPA: secretin N-terminal domain-containing protein [Phycisphaerales bacterium]|nr:secretin N-terminal domain-containing protein [Phycisphaerales bacterium]